LEEEQIVTRARIQKEELEASRIAAQHEGRRLDGAASAAMDDATKQRVQEELLVRNARAATIVLLNNITNMAAGVTALGGKVRSALEQRAASVDVLTIAEARDVAQLVSKLGTTLRQCNDAGQKAMEMSRLLVGEPTSIVGHRNMESLTIDEAEKRVAVAQKAIKRMKDKGIDVLDGNVNAVDQTLN
jgi:hypothetical protein